MSRHADAQAFTYGSQFFQVPGVIVEARLPALGPNGLMMLTIVLHLTGKHRSSDALVSHRTLRDLAGWGVERAQAAKRALCDAIPEAFTLIPGDAATRRPDVIRFDRDALAELHRRHLAEQGASAGNPQGAMRVTRTDLCGKPTEGYAGHPSNKKIPQDVEDTSSVAALQAQEGNIRLSPGPEGAEVQQARLEAQDVRRAGRYLSDAEVARFITIWNEGKHPRFAGKVRCSQDERKLLNALLRDHGGDVPAALETWTLAVSEVARLGADPEAMFWGDPKKRPTISNLLRHWGKHADAARARAERPAPQPEPEAYCPPAVI